MSLVVMTRQEELDTLMANVLLKLQLMPHTGAQKFNVSGHRHPESSPPPGAFRGDSYPEYERLRDAYNRAISNRSRADILEQAEAELASWHPAPLETGDYNFDVVSQVVDEGEGYEAAHVAERFGLDIAHVRNLRRRAGKRPDDGLPIDPTKLPIAERRREVTRLDKEGLSLRQIAAIVNASTFTVEADIKALKAS